MKEHPRPEMPPLPRDFPPPPQQGSSPLLTDRCGKERRKHTRLRILHMPLGAFWERMVLSRLRA